MASTATSEDCSKSVVKVTVALYEPLSRSVRSRLMVTWALPPKGTVPDSGVIVTKGSEELASRFERGKVLEVLKAAVALCDRKATDKEIGIDLECSGDLMVPMNGHLLEQAIVNLVDNAVKYSDRGGRIRVAAWEEGENVVIQVQVDDTVGYARFTDVLGAVAIDVVEQCPLNRGQ